MFQSPGRPDPPRATRPHNVLFQRIVSGDAAAIKECIDKYGNWVWKISINSGESVDEAEAIAVEIFQAIWKNAERIAHSPLDDAQLITLIASVELRSRFRTRFKKRGKVFSTAHNCR